MSKVQTFEEWFQETHGWNASYLIVSGQVDKLRDCWQAAMENAARVCEVPMTEVLLQVGEMPRQSIRDARFVLSGRAAAIREAAKR